MARTYKAYKFGNSYNLSPTQSYISREELKKKRKQERQNKKKARQDLKKRG